MSHDQELSKSLRARGFAGRYVLLGMILLLAAVSAGADPSDFGLSLKKHSGTQSGDLGISDFSVPLVLDDGLAETVFGFGGGTARQFLWFNRFENPGAFNLEEIHVLFPNGSDVPAGGAIQLAVFIDPDGDPTNGADLLATYDDLIQVVDGGTFSIYPVDPPLEIAQAGDILIGVVNRYFTTGSDPPPTFPAALDNTTSADRSYFALWPVDPPDPPDLTTADVVDVLDGATSGNFMIRGFGNTVREIPTLREAGLVLLMLLLGGAGVVLMRRL